MIFVYFIYKIYHQVLDKKCQQLTPNLIYIVQIGVNSDMVPAANDDGALKYFFNIYNNYRIVLLIMLKYAFSN